MYGNDHGNYFDGSNQPSLTAEEINKYTMEDYGLTVDALKNNHFGVSITDPRTGEHLPDAFYRAKLEVALAHAEKMLDVVLIPRMLREYKDFHRNDYQSNMFLHTDHKPIVQLDDVSLSFGGQQVFRYPPRWWRIYNLFGHIQMLPTMMLSGEQGGLSLAQAYSGYPMVAGVPAAVNHTSAPQMLKIDYVAGMLPPQRRGVTNPREMHPDFWEVVIKLALVEIFQQWGRLILGPGIQSKSIAFDGMQQSIDTTQSAMYGAASAEMNQLKEDIHMLTTSLKAYYGHNLGIL